ncbi:MAG: SurA N-terminal domain-containing protein [Deltaproteobacteria bacterium]|nr:SurA N-terminal domain-containing protein [Deltaproteobacteria bacterium]
MLLSMMRRHAKSWLIKLLIGIIAVVFIFYFGYSFTSKEGVKVATVNGETISGIEYQKAYRDLLTNLQKEYQSVWSDNLIKVFDLKNRALEGLIEERILSQEAKRIGLDVTEEEIRNEILAFPSFQFQGGFDENRYRTLLLNNRMKPEDFEKSVAQELLQRKLGQFLSTFLPVTDQETLESYIFANEQVNIEFIRISPADFHDKVEPEKLALEKYFEEHQDEYIIPEKIKITYILLDPDKFRDQVDISEQDILEYYEDNMSIWKEEKQVRVRHILFRLEPGVSEAEEENVRRKAMEVLKMCRDGEDFSELAKKYSEDVTREEGGDLGFFSKGQMIKPFEDAAFSLEKGDISDLIKTPYGFHIIKVEEVKDERTKTFDEVHDNISEILEGNYASDLANEKGLNLIDQLPYDMDLTVYAKEHNVPVADTDFFAKGDPIPSIGGDQKLKESLFSMDKKDVSELVEFDKKFFIIQVSDKKPSYMPELGEVIDQCRRDFVDYLATQEVRSTAEDYLAKLKEGKSWDELVKEKGLKTDVTGFFSRMDMIPKIGYAAELQEEAFSLGSEKVYPNKVFENEEGVYVIRWLAARAIDNAKYEEDKGKFRDHLMSAKQQMVFRNWLENLKHKADIDRSPFGSL